MNIIVVTDLGRDPDDFFAICYLHTVQNVNIRAILVSPGDSDQIAVAKFFCNEMGIDIPVGSDKCRINKTSSGGMHYDLLNKYGFGLLAENDGMSYEILKATLADYPDSEIFACGPLTCVGQYLEKYNLPINDMTIQGGFLPYDSHNISCVRLEKFVNKKTVPTFNLNGDIKAALRVVESPLVKSRRFVSKNVCHTIVYDKTVHEKIKSEFVYRNTASDLFIEAMDLYLSKHPEKKFHDPTAAVCHLHPEIAKWVNGKLYVEKGQWGTNVSDTGDRIIADINRDELWKFIASAQ